MGVKSKSRVSGPKGRVARYSVKALRQDLLRNSNRLRLDFEADAGRVAFSTTEPSAPVTIERVRASGSLQRIADDKSS